MARVLLVDDDANLREVYETLLTALGHDVTTVADGQAAIQWLLDNDHPDLVLMDMEMPLMNGVEATRKIREREELRDLMVVLLTSHQQPENVGEGLASGADAYVVKPASPEDVVQELQLILGSATG